MYLKQDASYGLQMRNIFQKVNKAKKEINENEYTEEVIEETQVVIAATTQLLNLETELRKMMFFYESAIDKVCSQLQILKNEFKFRNDRNPIDSVQSRIKSMESISGKMNKLGIPITLENIAANLQDIAGVRVICPFVKDVYYMADVLLKQNDITLLKMKDYISNPKPNGYRSLHLIVMVEVSLSDQKTQVPVEIQLRTIAMNSWASLEHQLRYKKDYSFTDEMEKELEYCSKILAESDSRMQILADKLVE